MLREYLPTIVEGSIPILIGIWATLTGNRLIGPKPGTSPREDLYHKKFGAMNRLLGPVLIVVGLVMFFNRVIGNRPLPLIWQTVSARGGVCSIEMPGQPSKLDDPRLTSGSVFEVKVPRGPGKICLYRFIESELTRDLWPAPGSFRTIRDTLVNQLQQTVPSAEVISERDITIDGIPGYEIETASESVLTKTRILFISGHVYQAVVVTGTADTDIQERERFLNSIRFSLDVQQSVPHH
jgi:hypothetical protein